MTGEAIMDGSAWRLEVGKPTLHESERAGPTITSASESEGELVARAQRGDEEAFAALFEMHKRRVYSLCLRMTNDRNEAEDLTQDAFLQVFRKISTFRGESAFSTWLYRLVVNVVLMKVRRRKPPLVSLGEPTAQDEPARREPGARDLWLAGTIDRMTLERAIRELPRGYRAVFILHDVEGYEHREIAAILNCTPGNCKSQLHKARLRLRHWLRLHAATDRVLRPRRRPLASEILP